MKGSLLKTKSAQYSFLQFLALLLSAVAYLAGSMAAAIAMIVVATVFGVLATRNRLNQARERNQRRQR